jgi:hypothetical protein
MGGCAIGQVLHGSEKSVNELANLLRTRDTMVFRQLALLRKDGRTATRCPGHLMLLGERRGRKNDRDTLFDLLCGRLRAG